MADLVYASGAVHDVAGPITAFAPITPAGQAWFDEYAVDGSYVIETHLVDMTIGCIEGAGLTVSVA